MKASLKYLKDIYTDQGHENFTCTDDSIIIDEKSFGWFDEHEALSDLAEEGITDLTFTRNGKIITIK